MQAPITLPEGWTIEDDPSAGAVITGFDSLGNKGFITVCEIRRSFEHGICAPKKPMDYKGHGWRKQLYQDAVIALFDVLEPETAECGNDEFEPLLPARTGLLDVFNWYTASFLLKQAVYGFGTASIEQKRAALNTLHRGGDQLSRHYFLGRDSHELWVDSKLIGLCCLGTGINNDGENIIIDTTLSAIFLLKRFRGNGLSSQFIECIWNDLRAVYTKAIAEAASTGVKSITVCLSADFESIEGEAVFMHLREYVSSCLTNAEMAFKVKIELSVDAGF